MNRDEAREVLETLHLWAKTGDADVLGRLVAGDIRSALDVAIGLLPKPKPKRCERTIEMFPEGVL